jgi:hypothetical protein
MAFVTPADVSAAVGFPFTASTRPTESAVESWIGGARVLVEGILRSRGIGIPLDEGTSPHAFTMVFNAVRDIVAVQAKEAHYITLDGQGPGFFHHLREERARWERFLDTLRRDKGILDDAERLTNYAEVDSHADFIGSAGRPPVFKTSDTF